MTGRMSGNIKRLIVSLLILIGFSSAGFSFQKNLSGNFGQPSSHVVTIGGGPPSDRVTVSDVTGFQTGDTVLLIQMQGVKIYTDLSIYGSLENKFGEPGLWEFLIVQSVTPATKEIVFRNSIINPYDPKGNVQIVRIPYYNSATVTGTLICDTWSPVTKSGGVLAMIVGRTLKLNANIDVTGRGFSGGKDSIGDGKCRAVAPVTNNDYYDQTFTNAGYKGEGIANYKDNGTLLSPLYVKGLGPNYTGGGGGNGKYSGGGGGSHRGIGGDGGYESSTCSAPQPGGKGGFKAEYNPALLNRIFMGGGGGASTRSLTGTSGPGGNGGGVVIIITDTIIGNGGKIIANGGDGGNAIGLAGSGGGGAAGSIALSLNSYGSDSVKFYLMGGKGGDNAGTFGEGGGGGGGLLWVSTDVTSKVKTFFNGGANGESGDISASPGNIGDKRLAFKANLNGFLFNSIRSSVTGDQIDSICSNMLPRKISGTKPVGGTPSYTYLWEKSYDQITWSPLVNDTPDPTNYTPTVVETTTVYFRRTITDSSTPVALTDVSKPVKIIVQPFIKNNIVGDPDTICFKQDPPLIHQLLPDLTDGNNKSYFFSWQVSINNAVTWGSSVAATKDYDPPIGLDKTSWYRRTVTSGRCVDSTAIVKITVLDTIKNNIITSPAEQICHGMLFTNLVANTSPVLTGGDNIYKYKWESSVSGATWAPATGINTNPGYNPDESSATFPGKEYFRRIVYSGIHDVCTNTSTPVLLTDWKVITNNNISADETICSGSIPATITGPEPSDGAGPGSFTYTWQDSSKLHNWADISGFVSVPGPNYLPAALTDTTRYRRIAISSACSDISKSIIKRVHKPIANNNILLLSGAKWDTTICKGATPRNLKGTVATGGTNFTGDYAFQWYFSPDKSAWSVVPSGGTGKDYQPPALNVTTYYERKVISGMCSSESDSIVTIKVLPSISNNIISANQTICYNTSPAQLTGPVLTGGAGGTPAWVWQESLDGLTWSAATGTNNQQNYSPPSLTVPMTYRRIIFSGPANCCIDTSNVILIGIDQLSSVADAGPDKDLYTFDYVDTLHALKPVVGTGAWSVLAGTGTISGDSIVSDLSDGENKFEWTVTNGTCVSKDQVVITVYNLLIPEGFSPNNDGINDEFVVKGLDIAYSEVTLRILNSAGTPVFFTSNSDGNTWTNWNGENENGILPEGTYYYLLTIKSVRNGTIFKKSGFIILKRYNMR